MLHDNAADIIVSRPGVAHHLMVMVLNLLMLHVIEGVLKFLLCGLGLRYLYRSFDTFILLGLFAICRLNLIILQMGVVLQVVALQREVFGQERVLQRCELGT